MRRPWPPRHAPLALAAIAAAGCGSEPVLSQPGIKEVPLPASAVAQMSELLAGKAARSLAQRKISSALLYARTGEAAMALARAGKAAPQIVPVGSLATRDDDGRVLVDILSRTQVLPTAIERAGGRIVTIHPRSMRAWLALDRLEALAADPAVVAIHPAFTAVTSQAGIVAEGGPGSRVSEGDRAHAADRARRYFGVDGTGVTIGVLSDSDDHKEQAIATGDLPAGTVTLPGQSGRPGRGEGTAMMEIVHDVAPGADLVFATALGSPHSFADNIRALRFDQRCDVIVDDVLYFFESPYQDDVIAQAVDDVTRDGALYFASAGNTGNFENGTSGTWEGDFEPAHTLPALPSGHTVHAFSRGAITNRIETGGGPVLLHWADPGHLDDPAAANDYDLFVLDAELRNVILAATDIQDGSGLPFEFLGYRLPDGFRIVIVANPGAEPRALRTAVFRGELALGTPGSTYGHNSTADSFSVAAVDVAAASTGTFSADPAIAVEAFSADGPRRLFYRSDNGPIVAGHPGATFASRAGVVRAKPDIAAADGVITTFPDGSGLNPFFGTSAAAPHAAAIAGLAKSALPSLGPAQLRDAIIGGAIDIGPPGSDRSTGHGIVSAFATLARAGVPPVVALTRGGVTASRLDGGVLQPGDTAQIAVELVNRGGAPATGVSAVLTTSSPGATILQGASAYPDVGGESTAVNTTPFAVATAATMACGSALQLTLTVRRDGAPPLALALAVQLGRPTTARFAYTGPAVAIPDADPAGVSVPLAIAYSGRLARLVVSIDGEACTANTGAASVGVDHSWVGDLTFVLASPSGRSATLLDAPGGTGNSGNNLCRTVLDDTATASIQSVIIDQAPYTGAFAPVQPLSVFAGDDASGTWTLHVRDSAVGDLGRVRAFSIDLSGFSCGP